MKAIALVENQAVPLGQVPAATQRDIIVFPRVVGEPGEGQVEAGYRTWCWTRCERRGKVTRR